MKIPEIILLGGPNSGKTHYAGQLYGRLQRSPQPTLLKVRVNQGTPTNLSALENVLNCLENGNAADHTSTDSWNEILFPLVDNVGNHIDLCWPDYGGEQLLSILKNREVTEGWHKQLEKADGWVLLIRLNDEILYTDALNQLTQHNGIPNGRSEQCNSWDANAKWIELLQILLHVSVVGTAAPLKSPRLVILLSCYDEILENNSKNAEKKPFEVLAERLPLVATFVESNWEKNSVSIWGLSSLGKKLESNSDDSDFAEYGPEYQGWIINPDGGEQDPDLTKPLAWLLK